MADWVTARGAFRFPHISGPVPLKSKTALPSRRSMVIASIIGLPSSRRSPAVRLSSLWRLPVVANPFRLSRTAASAAACTWPIYAWTTGRPYISTISRIKSIPLRLAATWALRSEILSDNRRVPLIRRSPSSVAAWSRSAIPCSWKIPFSTSLNERIAAPSSTSRWECGGMEPGEIPPTSA